MGSGGSFAVLRPEEIDVTIAVVSGSGSALFYANGRIDKVAITPSVGSAADNAAVKYNAEIVDRSSNGVWGKAGIVGKATIKVDALCLKSNTITLSSVSKDGTFTIRLWIDYGA